MIDLSNFKKSNNVEYIIGFSGGSDDSSNIVQEELCKSFLHYKDKPIAILTGGTKWGVPLIAHNLAKEYGLPSIGVMPERGIKYKVEGLDLEVIVEPRFGESEYGDESELFAKIGDAFEFIGGSAGTAVEYSHIMKINDRLLKNKLKPKYIAPIVSLEGFSQEIPGLSVTRGVTDKYSPRKIDEVNRNGEIVAGDRSEKLYSGSNAAQYLLTQLGLYGK